MRTYDADHHIPTKACLAGSNEAFVHDSQHRYRKGLVIPTYANMPCILRADGAGVDEQFMVLKTNTIELFSVGVYLTENWPRCTPRYINAN